VRIQETDSALLTESLTFAAILGTRLFARGKAILPPHPLSLIVGAFYRLWWRLPCQGRQLFLPYLPAGFFAPKDQRICMSDSSRQRKNTYDLHKSDTTAFYLLTVSIAALVFLLAIISAFGVIRRHAPQAPGGGNSRDDDNVHGDVNSCDGDGYPREGSRIVIIWQELYKGF
jgi:hypothetical protein